MEAINMNSNTQHNRIRKGTLRNAHNSQQSSWACVTLTCGLTAHGISTREQKSIKSITENKNHLHSKCTKIHNIEFQSLWDIFVSTPEKSVLMQPVNKRLSIVTHRPFAFKLSEIWWNEKVPLWQNVQWALSWTSKVQSRNGQTDSCGSLPYIIWKRNQSNVKILIGCNASRRVCVIFKNSSFTIRQTQLLFFI
jgi:hypothetical protein